ncbi:uncharacterized protein BO97DRAFT_355160, partial [Aspergillus homomorphus CBS 101889]
DPRCSLSFGLAYVTDTKANIRHLDDVQNVTCSVPADSCARVSNQNLSSIFFCNYESTAISTKCGTLIEPAKSIQSACRLRDFYDYGYLEQTLTQGTVEYKYTIALGGEFPNSA